MKLRNIKTTLENINEAIKYVVFALTSILIASFGLFIAHYYQLTGEIVGSVIVDGLFVLVLLGLTISSRGSVSLRRTTLMIIFGLFNLYGAIVYAFYYEPLFIIPSQLGDITQIFLYVSVAAASLNVLILIYRAIILVQYDVCVQEGIDQLNKQNYYYTFKKAVRGLGVSIPNLILYALMYQGLTMLINVILDVIDYKILVVENLVISLVILIIPALFITLFRRYIHSEDKKYLGFAAIFVALNLAAMIAMIVIHSIAPENPIIIDLGYIYGVCILGFGYTLYLLLMKK